MPAKAKAIGEEMNVESRHIELFDTYLEGKFSAEWKKAFEDKLRKDAVLNEAFEDHVAVLVGIRKAGRMMLKSELAAMEITLQGKVKKYRTPKQKVVRWIIGGVVLVGLAAAAFWMKDKLPDLKQPVVPVQIDSVPPSPSKGENKIESKSKKQEENKQMRVPSKSIMTQEVIYILDDDTVKLSFKEAKKLIESGAFQVDTTILELADSIRNE